MCPQSHNVHLKLQMPPLGHITDMSPHEAEVSLGALVWEGPQLEMGFLIILL